MTLRERLDAIQWPKAHEHFVPGRLDYAIASSEYHYARTQAALALLALCEEWIGRGLHQDHCGLRSTTTAITERGITVTYEGSCTCGRDALLAKLREVGHE